MYRRSSAINHLSNQFLFFFPLSEFTCCWQCSPDQQEVCSTSCLTFILLTMITCQALLDYCQQHFCSAACWSPSGSDCFRKCCVCTVLPHCHLWGSSGSDLAAPGHSELHCWVSCWNGNIRKRAWSVGGGLRPGNVCHFEAVPVMFVFCEHTVLNLLTVLVL